MKVVQEGWEDVSLEEFIEIEQIKKDNRGYLNKCLEILSYLTDSDEWDNKSSKEVIAEFSRISWINHPPLTTEPKEWIGDLRLKPFNKLSLSEWIDLDSAIMKADVAKVCAIIYKKSKIDEWGNIEYEPYKYSPTQRARELSDLPVTEVAGVWNSALKYRENILKAFAGLFDGYDEEKLTEEETEMLSPSEIKEIEEGIKNDNRKKDYAWQKLLDSISGGVWSHIPDILELPHTFVFNMRMAQKVYGD